MYINYGCGNTAPKEWINFDASPTLILEKFFFIKKKKIFPKNVKFGNIIKGLPIAENSCRGVFCSHILEHLSLEDFEKALKNTYRILKPNGIFRLIMPDLQNYINIYIESKNNKEDLASIDFLKNTMLGKEKRVKGFVNYLKNIYGNSNHLWMWDKESTIFYLQKIGFNNIIEAKFGEYQDNMFQLVESESRYYNSFALEVRK